MGSEKYPNLGFDPAPGDLETVRLLVAVVGKVAHHGGEAQTHLHKLGTSDAIWVGKSADAFSDSVANIPPYLKKALGSLSTAHRALSTWESSLSGFQARARRLEEEGATVARKVSSARDNLDQMPDDVSHMSAKEKEEHEKDKKSKQSAYDSASSDLDDVRNRAHALHAEYSSAGDDTSRLIKGAADDAPPKPGWFDRLVHDIGEVLDSVADLLTDPNFWALIGDVLADVAMVLAVVALICLLPGVGEIAGLAMVSFLVGAGALGAHGLAMALGSEDVTWKTLAWDTLGVVAGGASLGGAKLARVGGKAMQAGSEAVSGGRALRAAEGFMAKGGLKTIKSGIQASGRGYAQAARGWVQYSKGFAQNAAGEATDFTATVSGAAFAFGSNMTDTRWSDGKFKGNDIPVVGPFLGVFQDQPGKEVEAPGPMGPQPDSNSTLGATGNSFAQGIQPTRAVPVA
ncbi:putative T7SS-secreted protein [Streptomyces sp. NPDC088348]|uniref:putative T7SS-secreted protein n=1 Tax=Streptomyces sp. NPDC088348 TaxID=3365853 RepID=UPI00382B7419